MSSQPPPNLNVSGSQPPPTAQQPQGATPPPAHTVLPERKPKSGSAKFSWRSYFITVVVLEVIFFVVLIVFGLLDIGIGAIIIIFLVVLFFATVINVSVFFLNKFYSRFIEKKNIQRDINQLQEHLSEDFFTNLIRINFKYIDKYYLQTQVQANRSFTLAAVAAVVSLLIIIIGILMMYYGNSDKLSPAYMTTISGLLGEFVSTVFFILYNRTVLEMSQYHQKLVLTQNVSLALKLAQELPDADKAMAQVGLIESLSKDINMYLTMQISRGAREPAPLAKMELPQATKG